MISKSLIKIPVCLASLVFLIFGWTSLSKAQLQDNRWSEIYRLSINQNLRGEGYITADQFGNVHVFWADLLSDGRSLLQYTRNDGISWSPPIDIFMTDVETTISSISPFVDLNGIIHLVWTTGINGPAYYSTAYVNGALSAQNWDVPRPLYIPARDIKLVVDDQETFHILYSSVYGDQPGVFYTNSVDQGDSWSSSFWLDPDIPTNFAPMSLQFGLDHKGGLHAVWYYIFLDSVGGDWVRYAQSADGGYTWDLPITIDKNDVEESKLRAAEPVMAIQADNIHIVWASGEQLLRRYHRFSTDLGQSWEPPNQIFGDLNGQAFDGMSVDGVGRVHFFGQIRYPQGIYHAYWDQGKWTSPSLIYLIAQDSTEEIGNRIHAHYLRSESRAGNQLFLIFSDPPGDPERGVYVMNRNLNDIPSSVISENLPSTETIVPSVEPTIAKPIATSKPLIASQDEGASGNQINLPSRGITFFSALVPAILIIGLFVIIQLWRQGR